MLRALLGRLGVAQVAVVGSSMGGRLAWRFAAAAPAQVTKLALLAPAGLADTARPPQPTPWWVNPLLRALPYSLPRPLVRRMMANAYAAPGTPTETTVERSRDMLLAPGARRAILARSPQLGRQPPPELLATIRVPVLLLWGEADRAVPVAAAAEYQRRLPQARLVLLPGIGHVPMEEAPEASAAALRDFLGE